MRTYRLFHGLPRQSSQRHFYRRLEMTVPACKPLWFRIELVSIIRTRYERCGSGRAVSGTKSCSPEASPLGFFPMIVKLISGMIRKSSKQEKFSRMSGIKLISHPARGKNATTVFLKYFYKGKFHHIPLKHSLIWSQKNIPQPLITHGEERIKA